MTSKVIDDEIQRVEQKLQMYVYLTESAQGEQLDRLNEEIMRLVALHGMLQQVAALQRKTEPGLWQ